MTYKMAIKIIALHGPLEREGIVQAYLIEGIFTPMFLNLALTSGDNLSSSVIRSMLVLS